MNWLDRTDTLEHIARELDDLSTLLSIALSGADGPTEELMRIMCSMLEQDADSLRFVSTDIEMSECDT